MDGMLSQSEINALLNGMELNSEEEKPDEGASAGSVSDGAAGDVSLTDVEKDAIGEVANISMGTSATTLFSLVNKKVNITTPVVELATWDTVAAEYERPCVFITIKYTVGLDGQNILVLKENDVKVITDLMMGGDGTNTDGELGELHLSAISEAMNQMMGSSATSLSSMLGNTIDISPPEANLVNVTDKQNGEDISDFLKGTFVKISFRMQIEDLVDSTLMQLYPIDFAQSLYKKFMDQQLGGGEPEPAPAPQAAAPTPAPAPQAAAPTPAPAPTPAAAPQAAPMQMAPEPSMQTMAPQMGMPMQGMAPQMGMPMQGMMPGYGMQGVNIQPAQFQNFTAPGGEMVSAESIGLIKDVPLEVTVELGRTSKNISDILEFAPGTIIELDKIAGEPIDVLVNGKFVAKGEVVVIEESFGVRIIDIVKQ